MESTIIQHPGFVDNSDQNLSKSAATKSADLLRDEFKALDKTPNNAPSTNKNSDRTSNSKAETLSDKANGVQRDNGQIRGLVFDDKIYSSATAGSKTNETKFSDRAPTTQKSLEKADSRMIRAASAVVAEPSTPVSDERFVKAGKEVLLKINPDGAPVTKAQLAAAMEDPSYKGDQAQALAAMYEGFDKMHNLDSHEYIWNRSGFTAGDLDKIVALKKEHDDAVKPALELSTWSVNHLKDFADKDGILHLSAIEKALKDPKISHDDKTNLNRLVALMPEIGQRYDSYFGDKGVKASDIDAHLTKVWSGSDAAKMVNEYNFDIARTAAAQQAGVSRDLYASTNPLDSIKPDAIKQGRIGNCYFEAALAAVAKDNPEMIKNAIKDNHDGTYTVTFPGASSEPITVKAPTAQELGLYNGGGQNGVWASIMEKAYGKYRDNHAWVGSYTPQDAADGGGDPAAALKLLTGKETSTVDLSDKTIAAASVAKELEQAFATSPPSAVTASSMVYWKGFFHGWDQEGSTPGGFIKNHAFTVTGFHPDGKGGGTVSLRNPWGGENGTARGSIEIPLADFITNFRTVKMTK